MTANPKPTLQVLVVEDQPTVAQSLSRILALGGYRAEVVFGSEDALKVFKVGTFDLVITDYAMPGMKGDALAAAIRERAPAQRIIMVTGFAELFREVGKPAAVDLVVSKPLEVPRFLTAIDRLLRTESTSS